MKKVLIVGPTPPEGSYIGGIGIMLKGITGNWSSKSTKLIYLNSETRQRDFSITGRFGFSTLKYSLVLLSRVLRKVKEERPDIIHFHSSWGAALLKDLLISLICKVCYSCKLVFHIHYADLNAILLPRSRFLKAVQINLLYRCCDNVILMADLVQEGFLSIAPSIASRIRDRSVVLRNFTIISDKHRGGPSDDYKRILFLGNIGRRKGAFDIIEACSVIRDQIEAQHVLLTFAGPFDSAEVELEFKNLIKKSGLTASCILPGSVLGQEKEQLFLDSDLFLLPSYAEGVPIAMLEAMSYGLPVIVSTEGGMPEVVINNEHGLLVSAGDISALSGAISMLIDNHERRVFMGNQGRKLIEREYSLNSYLERLDKVYQGLVA